MNTPHDNLPPDLVDVAALLDRAGRDARGQASPAVVERLARTTWSVSAPVQRGASSAAVASRWPLRLAASVALLGGLLASVLALRAGPGPRPMTLAQQSPSAATATSADVELFATYLASTDGVRDELDLFATSAGDLADSVNDAATGDWWGDADNSTTQGAS